jgi:membrane protein YqaA with SNARE-associated domain
MNEQVAPMPEPEVPEAEVPEAEVPEAEVPEAEVPEAEVPEAEVPEAEVPEAEVPTIAPPTSAQTPPRPDAPSGLDPELRRLLRQMAYGLVGVIVAVTALAYTFRDPLLALSRRFVETFGGPGVALGYFLPDALFMPIPQEAVKTFALLGGMGFWEIVAWGVLGTLLGGPVGYWGGRLLARRPRVATMLARRGARAHAIVSRYGAHGVAIGALTPLPYSLTCWAAGALGLRFRTFLLVSLLRIPRVIFFLWLIELGALTVLR